MFPDMGSSVLQQRNLAADAGSTLAWLDLTNIFCMQMHALVSL